VESPDGFLPAEDIRFRVDESGKVYIINADGSETPTAGALQMVKMIDHPTRVRIVKVDDNETPQPVIGAYLWVKEKGQSDIMARAWTTTADGWNIFSELKWNTEYTLYETETNDPTLQKAEAIDFIIDKDGVVYHDYTINDDGTITGTAFPYDETIKAYVITMVDVRQFELPLTGGAGTYLFTLGGLLCMTTAVMYGIGLRRRRERRAK